MDEVSSVRVPAAYAFNGKMDKIIPELSPEITP